MCLAIFKPGKLVIPEDNLAEGWLRNPDGAGFAYIERGTVKVAKGFMSYKEFIAQYQATAKKFKNSPFLVHFRIRSMGDKSSVNTHPFVLPTGALIHNGTLSGTGAIYQSGASDTALFVKKYKDVLNYDFAEKYKTPICEALTYNKVAMLFDGGKHVILNEKDGVWDGDVWYSNHSYRRWEDKRAASYKNSLPSDNALMGSYLGDF